MHDHSKTIRAQQISVFSSCFLQNKHLYHPHTAADQRNIDACEFNLTTEAVFVSARSVTDVIAASTRCIVRATFRRKKVPAGVFYVSNQTEGIWEEVSAAKRRKHQRACTHASRIVSGRTNTVLSKFQPISNACAGPPSSH